MSKLNDIKKQIDQMDGGSFQNLCDAYLSCKGYRNIYSLGMNTGTNKTAKGSPDTYFLTAENKYIFVMYTTQKNNFVKKAIEDIDKCFDVDKTGIPSNDIEKIIYCHTFGRLTPGDDNCLRQRCKKHGAILTLIGLDQLGNDIFREYPFLAKDFFNISIDSGQIFPLDTFITRHDANSMAAPLGTKFLFREKELERAKTALESSDVLLIAGQAGVGKTRFALELCQQLTKEKGYATLVIKNNNLPLYEDLASVIEERREYLVLIDDANELSGLCHVLDYLPKATGKFRNISKLILTVRDYARKQVMDSVIEVTKPEIIKITTFSDDDICKLIRSCYGITNPVYTNRIVRIAEGNARLAMLAGKLAVETECLSAIQNASDLYYCYYRKQLNALIESDTGVSSAGIIAFIQAIHLEHLEHLAPVFASFNITSSEFISDLKLLHKAEIVDLCNDEAARISDQSFGNFLIKYVFIDEKRIYLSTMIETCFFVNKSRTVEACNILLNVFSAQCVKEYVEDQINIVWDKLENNLDVFIPFFNAFYMVRPTQTLLIIKERIEQTPLHSFDAQSLSLENSRPDTHISDKNIQILSGFEDHQELPTALDLLLLYYNKRPDLFEQFYSVYAGKFNVNADSRRMGYFTQSAVVKSLCDAVEANPNDINLLVLFVRVANQLLKLDISKVEGGRHNTVSVFTMALLPDKPVLEYRRKLLTRLFHIYKHGNMQTEIESLLYKYGIPYYGIETNDDVVRAEFGEILNFFTNLQPLKLYHCVIAEHIQQVANRIKYTNWDILVLFLHSEEYKIYSVLASNDIKHFATEYEQNEQRHKERVRKLVEQYTAQDVDRVIRVCVESSHTFDKDERALGAGLHYLFEALQNREQLFLHLIDIYMEADTPYRVNPRLILEQLFAIMPASKVKKYITKYKYSQRNIWLWYFYSLIPEAQISIHWTTELLQYLDTPDLTMKDSPLRRLDALHKYEKIEPQIIFKALRIVLNHYEESQYIFSLYSYWLLNHRSQQEADDTVKLFSDELDLLEEIYLKGISYTSHVDSEGTLLYAILSADPSFLYRYLDYLISIQTDISRSSGSYDVARILKIWEMEDYTQLADEIFDYLYEKTEKLTWWLYNSPLKMILENHGNHPETIIKQDGWIKHSIEKYNHDEARMHELFSAIAEFSCDRRKEAVAKFLSLNDDPEIFEKLPLEPSTWGGSGSMIPCMQDRIEYLRSLLPILSGIKYLKQRQRVLREIEDWKKRINDEEVSELLESWYR